VRAGGLIAAIAGALLLAAGCAPSLEQRRVNAAHAVELLQDGSFADAEKAAAEVLDGDPGNAFARLVSAITRYKTTMHDMWTDVQTIVVGAALVRSFNQRYLRQALEHADDELALVAADLEAAAAEPEVDLELCLACWEIDWNRSGRIDDDDERLMEIELDKHGNPYRLRDPRRRPTFRFDHGDVNWARAFIAFQRAAINLTLAYDWTGLEQILADREPEVIRFELVAPERVAQGRALILDGLDFADRARRDYLAETDDDREWVPNPVQQNHPLPLPVDRQLYDTWEKVIGDLKRLVKGEEGLSVTELAQLGDHVWDDPPRGYIDIGSMLSDPKDILIDLRPVEDIAGADRREETEALLHAFFGDYYVRKMKPSPLPRRVKRMKREVDRGQESLERKLRYLFWLN
jgi:hypothetical protein